MDNEKLIISGSTTSQEFPITDDAWQKKMIKGFNDESGFLLDNSIYIPWVECEFDEEKYSSNLIEFTLDP